MIEKLKSRKLWVTVGMAALAALLNALGVDPAIVSKIMTMAMTYVASQGLVDAVAAHKSPF